MADDIQAERRADIASEMPCVSEADTERRPEARGVCVRDAGKTDGVGAARDVRDGSVGG